MTVRSIGSVEFNRSGNLPIDDGGSNKYAGRDAVSAIGRNSSTWTHKARRICIRNNILYSVEASLQFPQDAQLCKSIFRKVRHRVMRAICNSQMQERAHLCCVTLTLSRFSWCFGLYEHQAIRFLEHSFLSFIQVVCIGMRSDWLAIFMINRSRGFKQSLHAH